MQKEISTKGIENGSLNKAQFKRIQQGVKMGLKITEKNGKYNLVSTTTDERVHDKKWISEEEAKAILIFRQFKEFMNETIKIGMDFPKGRMVNGKIDFGDQGGLKWILTNYKEEDWFDNMKDKVREILVEVGLNPNLLEREGDSNEQSDEEK